MASPFFWDTHQKLTLVQKRTKKKRKPVALDHLAAYAYCAVDVEHKDEASKKRPAIYRYVDR